MSIRYQPVLFCVTGYFRLSSSLDKTFWQQNGGVRIAAEAKDARILIPGIARCEAIVEICAPGEKKDRCASASCVEKKITVFGSSLMRHKYR